MKIKCSPSGGLEPPTFRLTVERASQLRHGGLVTKRAGERDSKSQCLKHEQQQVLFYNAVSNHLHI